MIVKKYIIAAVAFSASFSCGTQVSDPGKDRMHRENDEVALISNESNTSSIQTNVAPDSTSRLTTKTGTRSTSKSQLRFGLEYDIQNEVTIPLSVWESIKNVEENKTIRAQLDELDTPDEWVEASPIDLNDDDRSDLIILAKRPPLLGANVTEVWVFLSEGENFRLVLRTPALQVDFSKERRNGFRTVDVACLTATTYNVVTFGYDGKAYKQLTSRFGKL